MASQWGTGNGDAGQRAGVGATQEKLVGLSLTRLMQERDAAGLDCYAERAPQAPWPWWNNPPVNQLEVETRVAITHPASQTTPLPPIASRSRMCSEKLAANEAAGVAQNRLPLLEEQAALSIEMAEATSQVPTRCCNGTDLHPGTCTELTGLVWTGRRAGS